MVVLKTGDWVVHEDGRVGKIIVEDYTREGGKFRFHLVRFDNTFARMTHESYLTKIDPALYPILSDSTKGES